MPNCSEMAATTDLSFTGDKLWPTWTVFSSDSIRGCRRHICTYYSWLSWIDHSQKRTVRPTYLWLHALCYFFLIFLKQSFKIAVSWHSRNVTIRRMDVAMHYSLLPTRNKLKVKVMSICIASIALSSAHPAFHPQAE